MPGRVVGLLALICCLGMGAAVADDRFYQVVDPDGHVRTVQMPDAAAGQAAPPESAKPAAAAQPSSTGAASEKNATGTAAYDSDVYMDSETLEKSGFNPEKKKHFFFINDSSGSHLQESGGGTAPEPLAESPVVEVPRVALPNEMHEWAGQSLFEEFPDMGRCLSVKDREKAQDLKQGQKVPLLLDRRTRLFVHELGVVEAYRLAGNGMKTVTVRSYAGVDASPAFARPYLAVAGQDGCITRLLTGYFQYRYGATQSRHAMLEGSLIMHFGEFYLLVILPDAKGMLSPTSYPLSPDGQLSIKWQL